MEDLKKRREMGNFSPSQGEAWEVDNITFPNTNTMVPFDVETEDVEVDTQVAIPQMEPGSQFRVKTKFFGFVTSIESRLMAKSC